jgi:predicted DNA-binding transcriptional regulator AlpA
MGEFHCFAFIHRLFGGLNMGARVRPKRKVTSTVTAARRPEQWAGLFVPPLRISRSAVGWVASEVDAVIQARIAGRSDEEIRTLVRDLVASRARTTIKNPQILRLKEVQQRTGLSRSTIYEQIDLRKANGFAR